MMGKGVLRNIAERVSRKGLKTLGDFWDALMRVIHLPPASPKGYAAASATLGTP
jgi:hypothetical protein